MSYQKDATVRLTRDKGDIFPPAHAGAIFKVYRNEGFGCYILRGPIGNPKTENRLFAASEDEFQAIK